MHTYQGGMFYPFIALPSGDVCSRLQRPAVPYCTQHLLNILLYSSFSTLLALFVSHLLVDAPCFAGDNYNINTSILTSCMTTL